MATVDLVCTFDAANSDAWTGGTNISTNNNTSASIGAAYAALKKLAFTTNASSVIPPGAVKTAVQLILKYHSGYLCTTSAYVKDPGGFADGGSAAHTLTLYGSGTSTLQTSIDISTERPAVLTDDLADGYIRMFHDENSGYENTLYVDYLSLRVTYTEGGGAVPLMFMNENM